MPMTAEFPTASSAFVLFRDTGGSWVGLDLVRTPSTNRWTGATPSTGPQVKEYWVQAVDASGNVAVSSNKGQLYLSQVTPPPSGVRSQSTWAVQQKLPRTTQLQCRSPSQPPTRLGSTSSLDGRGFTPYTEGDTIPISGDGAHILTVRARTSRDTATEVVLIDTIHPVVNIVTPAANRPLPPESRGPRRCTRARMEARGSCLAADQGRPGPT